MSNETLQVQSSVVEHDDASDRGETAYVSPAMVLVGSAAELTQGGSYNDYDSPGVRKT